MCSERAVNGEWMKCVLLDKLQAQKLIVVPENWWQCKAPFRSIFMFKERLKGKYFDVKEDTYVRKCAKIDQAPNGLYLAYRWVF